MGANHRNRPHLALPMKACTHRQLRKAQPMSASSRRQLREAQLMSTSSRRQPREVLPQRCKGMGIANAKIMGVLLLIPLQASVGELTAR